MDSTQWYVSVDGKAVGPVTTELLIRGIEQGRVPVDALVCAAGEAEWQDLTRVPPFSYELFGAERPAPESAAGASTGAKLDPFAAARAVAPDIARNGFTEDPDYDDRADEVTPPAGTAAPAPEFSGMAAQGPLPGSGAMGQRADSGFDIEIPFEGSDEDPKPAAFDWARPIAPYFQPLESVELPDERLLIGSMSATPSALYVQEDTMWNVALCLAFGSKALAEAAAVRFFDAMSELGTPHKIEWMVFTLLSRGFMPSGIPKDAGQNGFATLLRQCPDEFQDYLV